MAETFKCYYTGAEVRLIYKGREYIFDTEKEAEEWFEEQEAKNNKEVLKPDDDI